MWLLVINMDWNYFFVVISASVAFDKLSKNIFLYYVMKLIIFKEHEINWFVDFPCLMKMTLKILD